MFRLDGYADFWLFGCYLFPMQAARVFTIIASFLGFSAIVLGAIGAHALSLGDTAHSFDVATRYQLIHALLMLFFANQLKHSFSWGHFIGACLIVSGCVFFCLGIYLKAFTGDAIWIEAAPVGGMSFMAAWLCIIAAKNPNQKGL